MLKQQQQLVCCKSYIQDVTNYDRSLKSLIRGSSLSRRGRQPDYTGDHGRQV